MYVHTTTDNCLAVFGRLTSCINEIDAWMTWNRLKLNTGKHSSLVSVHRINFPKSMLPSSWSEA